jgi:hypothetical protein
MQPQGEQFRVSDSWSVGPGEYILDSGEPSCGRNVIDPIRAASEIIAAAYEGGIAGTLVPILKTVAQAARPELGGEVGTILDAILGGGRYANCAPVSVVIPILARIGRIEFEASDNLGQQGCVMRPDGGCNIEWGKFDAPLYFPSGRSLIVLSRFLNWSADRTRNAAMTVTYTMGTSPFSGQ